ncbi:hypothetical protein AVEN_263149-1 [Araneus ventricosus]|uniref:Uncharacterized protein n=1 Tax=Araneus ventricosus TaxID=182803 RepID=A0A4Y2FAJ0_ARAVE|nr:hypothetical protein AVEN_263149-1 [Araneus ventricosus]
MFPRINVPTTPPYEKPCVPSFFQKIPQIHNRLCSTTLRPGTPPMPIMLPLNTEQVGWTWDPHDTERLPCFYVLLPYGYRTSLDGHGTTLPAIQNASPCPVPVAVQLPNRWMDMGPLYDTERLLIPPCLFFATVTEQLDGHGTTLRYRASPMPHYICRYSYEPVGWTWDTLRYRTSPRPLCLLPLQHRAGWKDMVPLTIQNVSPCLVLFAITATEPVGWTWDHSTTRTSPLCPVPVAIAATEPVGWTWDHSAMLGTSPHAPCLLPLRLPNRLEGHVFTLRYQNVSPCPRSICHYSYRTGWMDMGPLYDTERLPMPPCLLPLQLPNRLDGRGTTLRYRTPPLPRACCHYSYRTDWMDMGPLYDTERLLMPPCLLPLSYRTGWMDCGHFLRCRTSPHAPCLLPLQLPNRLEGHGTTLRYRTSPHALRSCCHYSYRTGWMDMGPLYDTERLPMPPCLLPLQLPNRLDGHGTTLRYRTPPMPPCLLPQLPNRLDGRGTLYDHRTPPHTTVPVALTMLEPVGWTWDHSTYRTSPPCPISMLPLQLPSRLDGHGTHSRPERPHAPCLLPVQLPNRLRRTAVPATIQNVSPCPRFCCHFSYRTVGWHMDHSTIQNVSPCVPVAVQRYRTGWMVMGPLDTERTPHAPCLLPLQLPDGWDGHADHSTIPESPHAPIACCHYSCTRTGSMDMGPLYDTERLLMPPCLLPAPQLPGGWMMDMGPLYDTERLPMRACCHYSYQTVGWTWGPHTTERLPMPRACCPLQLPEPVGWTWDHSPMQERRLMPPRACCPYNVTEPVGWTWDPLRYRTSLMPRACCHYSYQTGWMDLRTTLHYRTSPHCPVPVAITATSRLDETDPLDTERRLIPRACCHYS